ncbi:MAG: hypothetical protein BWX77_00075 [Bacteroidetes bacterium ADurb.Bin090]|nr:MAG: hypothetical protein BWX77_00075 [Bacteroidetes bacterium ADurb.Bin090]
MHTVVAGLISGVGSPAGHFQSIGTLRQISNPLVCFVFEHTGGAVPGVKVIVTFAAVVLNVPHIAVAVFVGGCPALRNRGITAGIQFRVDDDKRKVSRIFFAADSRILKYSHSFLQVQQSLFAIFLERSVSTEKFSGVIDGINQFCESLFGVNRFVGCFVHFGSFNYIIVQAQSCCLRAFEAIPGRTGPGNHNVKFFRGVFAFEEGIGGFEGCIQ